MITLQEALGDPAETNSKVPAAFEGQCMIFAKNDSHQFDPK
jgi:hypothetical protein